MIRPTNDQCRAVLDNVKLIQRYFSYIWTAFGDWGTYKEPYPIVAIKYPVGAEDQQTYIESVFDPRCYQALIHQIPTAAYKDARENVRRAFLAANNPYDSLHRFMLAPMGMVHFYEGLVDHMHDNGYFDFMHSDDGRA